MMSKNKVVATMFATIGAALLVLTQTAGTTEKQQPNKLEGAWTATIPGTTVHWSYTLTPDASGRKASIHGQFVVPLPGALLHPEFPQLLNTEYSSDFYGEAEMIGADKIKYTCFWYGLKSGVPFPEMTYIGVVSGEGAFVGPNQVQFTWRMANYDPNPTGIVTEKDQPFLVWPEGTSVDVRMSSMPMSALVQK